MAGKFSVLIVDDSPTVRHMLSGVINATPDMHVVGEAHNGKQAITMTQKLHPGMILMDLVMPEVDGLEATREIMAETPTPIVVISASIESYETDVAFQAIRAGALSVLRKPVGPLDPAHAPQIAEMLSTIRAMAGVRVIRHYRSTMPKPRNEPTHIEIDVVAKAALSAPQIVAVASSTGGPAALCEILRQLPAKFSLPIVIVQHIASDFVTSLADWLGSISSLHVTVAQGGLQPQPGEVYLAPGGVHLRLKSNLTFELMLEPGNVLHIPSGDILLESVARAYGSQAVGIVLTGMGEDGARGLEALNQAGAFTIAQDEATSVVFGMPKEAIARGAARQIMPLQEIPQALIYLSGIGNVNYGAQTAGTHRRRQPDSS